MKTNPTRTAILSTALSALTAILSAADFPLLKNGNAAFEIVQNENSPVMKHAAAELAGLAGEIGRGTKPAVLTQSSRKVPAILLTTDLKKLDPKSAKEAAKVGREGFLLAFSGKQGVIYGKTPMGVLYGVNEVMKRYGGIRFLLPGADGTYIPRKKDLSVPEILMVKNPSFAVRTQILGAMDVNSRITDTWNWLVRNNMQITGATRNILGGGLKDLEERGGRIWCGGHAFDPLMTGAWITRNGKEAREELKKLQKEHPEYFPVIGGKRQFGNFAQYNPCVCAPGLADRMSRNLMAWQEKQGKLGDWYMIGNNDVTSWCECKDCDQFDPVPRYRARMKVPNRYWYFVNQIAKPVLDKYPQADLWGWAYQNFNMAPDKQKPDPRLSIMLVYNRHCYRHRFDDPTCPVNASIYQMMKDFRKFPNRMATWDQVEDALSCYYLPMGRNYADRIRTYKKLGINGVFLGNYPPDGRYGKKHDKKSVHTRNTWKMNWMGLYAAACLLWDPDLNYDALMEEAGSLYYGKGWKGGMKAYHQLREKAFMEAPGCFGWGHDGSEPARLIASPFAAAQMEKYLADAAKAAAGDNRSLKHIADDTFFFRKKYQDVRKEFEQKLTAFPVYLVKETAVIDGKRREKFWKNAETISCFGIPGQKNGKAPLISCQAAADGKNTIVFAVSFAESGKVKEIQLCLPGKDKGMNVLHFTPDGKNTAKAESAVSSENGIRTMEIRLGQDIVGTQICSGCRIFADIRIVRADGICQLSAGSRNNRDGLCVWDVFDLRRTNPDGTERNIAGWVNGSFDDIRPRPGKTGKWEFPDQCSPRTWQLVDTEPGKLEMPFHPGSKLNRYVKLYRGTILNRYDCAGKELEFEATVQVSGPGVVKFEVYRHDLTGKRVGTVALAEYNGRDRKIDNTKWHTVTFRFKRQAPGEFFWILVYNTGKNTQPGMVDNMVIVPVK